MSPRIHRNIQNTLRSASLRSGNRRRALYSNVSRTVRTPMRWAFVCGENNVLSCSGTYAVARLIQKPAAWIMSTKLFSHLLHIETEILHPRVRLSKSDICNILCPTSTSLQLVTSVHNWLWVCPFDCGISVMFWGNNGKTLIQIAFNKECGCTQTDKTYPL